AGRLWNPTSLSRTAVSWCFSGAYFTDAESCEPPASNICRFFWMEENFVSPGASSWYCQVRWRGQKPLNYFAAEVMKSPKPTLILRQSTDASSPTTDWFRFSTPAGHHT